MPIFLSETGAESRSQSFPYDIRVWYPKHPGDSVFPLEIGVLTLIFVLASWLILMNRFLEGPFTVKITLQSSLGICGGLVSGPPPPREGRIKG